MKLTIARIFEVSLIGGTKAYEELQPFVEYVNSLADNLVRILLNGVGIGDNLDAQLLEVDVGSGTPTSIATRKNKKPIAVILARQAPRRPIVSGFAWDFDEAGALRVEAVFDNSSTKTLKIYVLAFFS